MKINLNGIITKKKKEENRKAFGKKMEGKILVEILHCPEHKFTAVSVNNHRVCGGKCCGRWEVIKTYAVPPEEIERAMGESVKAEEFEQSTEASYRNRHYLGIK